MGFRGKSDGQNGEVFSMTRSRLVGRGGARPGAGRPRKPVAGPTTLDVASSKTERVPVIPVGLSEDDLAKFCETLAFETLATVASTGTSESARVAASRELLDRARGKPKPAPAQSKPEQHDLFDHWGDLLESPKPQSGSSRNN
jgi:hypothetical protein